MRIFVNGQERTEGEQTTVAALLQTLGMEPRRVAVELNKQILPRARYAETTLKEMDELEIVTLVGGG